MPLYKTKGITMGLAASQAKLLSITSRLSDNELRSQSISAAKMALANKSSEASRKYMNALNTTEYTYRTYDDAGNKVFVPLTGRQLSEYGPLKNQYALVNTSGQVLLSERDAANYESSATLEDFLAKYGIVLEPTGETQMVVNPAYADALAQWQQDYNDWIAIKPNINDFMITTVTENTDTELYQIFERATKKCYRSATSSWSYTDSNGEIVNHEPEPHCYLHVLAHMIGLEIIRPGLTEAEDQYHTHNSTSQADPNAYPKNFTTTLGGTITINAYHINKSYINQEPIEGEDQNIANGTELMLEVSNAIAGTYNGQVLYAAENEADYNAVLDEPLKVLLNNYTVDSLGNRTLKTLQQKCIDLFYAVNDIYQAFDSDPSTNPTLVSLDSENPDWQTLYEQKIMPSIESFARDMSLIFTTTTVTIDDEWTTTYEDWLTQEPFLTEPPTIEEPIYRYNDANMAQWYINLWYRANGPSDTNTTITSASRQRYDILEDGLMNSQQWLKYALETCTVSIERVIFAEEVPYDNGIRDAVWNSVIYTNVLELNEETNDKAIAIAEAEYDRTQREIENKDKQYDSMLKLLDTEHSALQAEYESVQKIIPKNLERTLKIYS